MKNTILACCALAACFSHAAEAQVTVTDPWMRATLNGQPVAGAYMRLLSKEDARLVAASSPVAADTEIHEMKMENGIMKMRPVASLPLPGGKPVALEPGGFHIMLTGLNQQIREGEMMPLVLEIEDSKGRRQKLELNVPARSSASVSRH